MRLSTHRLVAERHRWAGLGIYGYSVGRGATRLPYFTAAMIAWAIAPRAAANAAPAAHRAARAAARAAPSCSSASAEVWSICRCASCSSKARRAAARSSSYSRRDRSRSSAYSSSRRTSSALAGPTRFSSRGNLAAAVSSARGPSAAKDHPTGLRRPCSLSSAAPTNYASPRSMALPHQLRSGRGTGGSSLQARSPRPIRN